MVRLNQIKPSLFFMYIPSRNILCRWTELRSDSDSEHYQTSWWTWLKLYVPFL